MRAILGTIVYILIRPIGRIAIKKIESVKSVKSAMSFFYIPFRHFPPVKRYMFLYILSHSLYIMLTMSILCT